MSAKLSSYYGLKPFFGNSLDQLFNWDFDFGLSKKLFETPMDVYETDKEVIVEVAFPGVSEDKWDIQLTEDSITIKAEKKSEESKDDGIIYHKKSYSESSFSTSFTLPTKVESQKANAKYKDGVLKLTLPKKEVVDSKLTKLKIT